MTIEESLKDLLKKLLDLEERVKALEESQIKANLPPAEYRRLKGRRLRFPGGAPSERGGIRACAAFTNASVAARIQQIRGPCA